MSKRDLLVYLTICILAYAAGYVTHIVRAKGNAIPLPPDIRSAFSQAIPPRKPDIEQPKSIPDAEVSTSGQDLELIASLRQTIAQLKHELVVYLDEINEYEAKFVATSADAQRGKYVMGMANKPGGMHALLHMQLSESLEPSGSLINFLGLDKEQATELNDLCRQTYAGILKWEQDNAVLVNEADNMLSYEIPPLPQNLFAQFSRALDNLVSSDDVDFVLTRVKTALRAGDETRIVTFRTERRRDGQASYRLQLGTKDEKGNSRNLHSSASTSATVPKRWEHLFQIAN